MTTVNRKEISKTSWEEDNNYYLGLFSHQCRGCGSLLASKLILRTMYEADPSVMVWGRSCGAGKSQMMTGGRIAMDGSGMLGMEEGLKFRGITDRNLAVMAGEGRTLEMGGNDFESAIYRKQQVTWVILDNQNYAESGSHATPMTPLKAATHIYTKGKPLQEKTLPLMMTLNNARYVATVSPAYVKDLQAKTLKALRMKPSYLHVLTPCVTGWIYEPRLTVQIARLSVQTGLFPLWEFEDGVMRRTIHPGRRVPVNKYLELQRRFDQVSEEDVLAVQEWADKLNDIVDKMAAGFSLQAAAS